MVRLDRRLLPTARLALPQVLSGTVANWSRDFGFLRRSEGPDVFVHKRRLRASGCTTATR